jgi:hypothetical protein
MCQTIFACHHLEGKSGWGQILLLKRGQGTFVWGLLFDRVNFWTLSNKSVGARLWRRRGMWVILEMHGLVLPRRNAGLVSSAATSDNLRYDALPLILGTVSRGVFRGKCLNARS